MILLQICALAFCLGVLCLGLAALLWVIKPRS